MSSATDGRMPLADAERLAEEVVALLASATTRIEVAGSIRRRKADIGDIEIVAVPRIVTGIDLFGDPDPDTRMNRLDDECSALLTMHALEMRRTNGRTAWGTKYKRASYQGFPLDIFSVTEPAQFGVIYVIRTGPADYSRLLVTDRRHGGMMPEWAVVRDGAIRHRATGEVIPTPEEEDVYRVLGIEPLSPEVRDRG